MLSDTVGMQSQSCTSYVALVVILYAIPLELKDLIEAFQCEYAEWSNFFGCEPNLRLLKE